MKDRLQIRYDSHLYKSAEEVKTAIEKFVDEYLKGADIVFGIRNNRKTDSFLKKTTLFQR